jgi:hypothetical protein
LEASGKDASPSVLSSGMSHDSDVPHLAIDRPADVPEPKLHLFLHGIASSLAAVS